MNAIRIRRRLDSPIAELPELSALIGKEVEIIVLEADDNGSSGASGRFKPVGHWEGPVGELDKLLQESAASRDADAELDRDGAS
jgi:hypothetical protein